MKSILITGANGFIGSCIVEAALERGMKVWAGVRRNSNRDSLADPRTGFVELDYSDRQTLKNQIETHISRHGAWDYVVHCAGLTKALRSEDFLKVNFEATRNLVETLKSLGAVPQKFLLMSSLSAFPDPDTEYGRSKLRAEQYMETEAGIPYIILRPTGVYGPRDRDYLIMLNAIEKGWSVTTGFQPQLLTFIYVKDLARAVFVALESKISGRAYSVSDGRVYTDSEYVELARRALGRRRIVRIRIPLALLWAVCAVAGTAGRIIGKPSTLNLDKYQILRRRDWRCDVSPLRDELGFEAEYDLERGLRETVEWMRESM